MNTLQDVYGIVITPAPETVKKFTQILKILLKTYLSFWWSYLMLAGKALYRILHKQGFQVLQFHRQSDLLFFDILIHKKTPKILKRSVQDHPYRS